MSTEPNTSTAFAAAPTTSAGYAWIEGEYVPIAEARIPITDAGVVWSDLTYDVVAVWDGSFFRLDEHLDRFENACRTIRLQWPLERSELRSTLIEVVRRSGIRRAYVSMIVTRGGSPDGTRDLRRFRSRLYCYAVPYIWITPPEEQAAGTDVIVARDVRRTPPGAIDPTVKNFQWGDFTRGVLEAYDRGARLPILTDGDGHVTEGPGFNVFVVKDGTLHTPIRGVLEGITRRTVLDIADELGLPVTVEHVATSTLYDAQEVFLTSTAGGVIPVGTLDGRPIGAGGPGQITTRIRDTYWAWHTDPRFTTPVDYGDVA